MNKNDLVYPQYGDGIIGVNVFFSVYDVFQLKELIHVAKEGDEQSKLIAFAKFNELFVKLNNALGTQYPSLFECND